MNKQLFLVDYPFEEKTASKMRPAIILTKKAMAMYVTSSLKWKAIRKSWKRMKKSLLL